jgi:HEAT repeat protein
MSNYECRRNSPAVKTAPCYACALLLAGFAVMPRISEAASPEDRLIAVLTSTASVVEKDAACRELRIVGTEKSIPALATLLTDEKLAHPARFALESMPYPAAGATLRDAVGKTKGLIRSGMIDSLGERRDARAVPVIVAALDDPDDQVAAAAAWALGKIGTRDAAEALRSAHFKTEGKRGVAIAKGLMLCANNLRKAGKESDASRYFGEASGLGDKAACFAGFAGLARAQGLEPRERIEQFRAFLDSDERLIRAAGASALPDLSSDELRAVAADFGKMATGSKIAILAAARIRGDRKLLPVVLDASKSYTEPVRVAAFRALGTVGDSSVLPQLVQEAAKAGAAAEAARESIAMLKGGNVDKEIVTFLKAERDPWRRAEWIDVLASRHPAGAVEVLLAEALHTDPTVRGHAMAALAQMASPNDLRGVIAGVLVAKEGTERDAAERAVVLLLSQVKPPQKRAALVMAAIDAAPVDNTALLPLAARFGGPAALERVKEVLANSDIKAREIGLQALCNWPDASVANELLREIDAAKDPATRTMLLRAYIRVASTPAQDQSTRQDDAQRLAGLKKAMNLAQHDDERAYILQRASAIRTLDSLHFVLPYVDKPALAEPACAAVAELAHHKELRDPNKSEFRPAIEKVLHTAKDQAVIDNCKRSRDMMNASK